ncbi:MAG: hypothetical protein GY751_23205 [Bacteroidetes bacterium]|nr:hypothetical protein [Bacteroidota bacterium]
MKTAVSKAFKENIKRALNAYGDSYISSIDYGASLCAIVEVTETAYATKLRKNLNASGESVIMSGKAAVEDKLQEAGKNSNLNIRIMSKGYDTPRIDSHDVASLISTMNNMPTVEGGVELFLNTTPISGLMPNLKEKIDKIISDQKANVAKYSTALNEHEEYKYKISLRRDHKGLFEGRSVSDSEAKKWCTECGKKVEELIKNLEFYQSYSMHAVPLPTSLSRSWKDPELKTFTWDTGTDSIANRKKHKVTEVWIKIKTSKKGSGGTDSTIHAGFKNLDPSGGWQLSKSDLHKDKFEAGNWDRFNVTFEKPYTLNDFTRPGCKFWLKGKDMSYSDKWTIDAMRVYLKVPTWKPGEQGLYHLIYTRDKDKNITKTSTYYFEFNRLPGASLTDDWNHFIQ